MHTKPVLARAALVMQDQGGSDATGHWGVRCRDLAGRDGAELGKGILEKVEMTGLALWTFVHDLFSAVTHEASKCYFVQSTGPLP